MTVVHILGPHHEILCGIPIMEAGQCARLYDTRLDQPGIPVCDECRDVREEKYPA